MANFNVNISNSLSVFEDSTNWGTAVWGTSFWGFGSESKKLLVDKILSETLTLADTILLTAGFNVLLSNSFSSEFEAVDESLSDGSGYKYVFTKPTTEADERNTASFTVVSGGAATWTAASATTTTWSNS